MNEPPKLEQKRKQYLFSYGEDVGITEWLNAQNNKAQSLKFLIDQCIRTYGTTDILEKALDQVSIFESRGNNNVSNSEN